MENHKWRNENSKIGFGCLISIKNLKTKGDQSVEWQARVVSYRDVNETDFPSFEGLDNPFINNGESLIN